MATGGVAPLDRWIATANTEFRHILLGALTVVATTAWSEAFRIILAKHEHRSEGVLLLYAFSITVLVSVVYVAVKRLRL